MTQLDVSTNAPLSPAEAAPAGLPVKLGRKRDPSRDTEIMDAAIEVLAETGYERMTIDMVAARAKAGKATLYRRWDSKSDLVIDAIGCMKKSDNDPSQLPDTGTLRGDLVALIKPRSVDDSERKMKVMAGVVSMLSTAPELSDAVHAVMVEPRAAINRILFGRAIERGEIPAGTDVDTLSVVSQAMSIYRVMVLRKPIDPEFILSVIDGVILPAVGLGGAATAQRPAVQHPAAHF